MRASYTVQAIATAIPTAITVEQVITGGNMLLASSAGFLAVLGGVWAWRKQRTQAKTAELERRIKLIELQEAQRRLTKRR